MSTDEVVVSGVQVVPESTAPSAAAAVITGGVLRRETTVSTSLEDVAAHFLSYERVDAVVVALTAVQPEDPSGWTHLGQRAWLREWVRPG